MTEVKKILILLMIFSLMPSAEANQHQQQHHRHRHHQVDNNKIDAKIIFVFDEQNQSSLIDKNSEKVVPIASITKLMTAMVTLDANLPMDEVISIGEDNLISKIKSRLKIGKQFTRADLLQLALMSSENRAALALAKSYPGGLEAFIPAMNAKATSLEMSNTKFFDPTGLDHNNVSTAKDLVKMVIAASSYPAIHEATTTTSRLLDVGKEKPLTFHNTNPLVSASEWDISVSKTGYIHEAGRCLVMQTTIKDNTVVIIILDSRTKYSRVSDAKKIKMFIEKQPRIAPPMIALVPEATLAPEAALVPALANEVEVKVIVLPDNNMVDDSAKTEIQ